MIYCIKNLRQLVFNYCFFRCWLSIYPNPNPLVWVFFAPALVFFLVRYIYRVFFYLGLWLNLSYQTQFKILVGYVPYWGRSNHIFMELRLLRMQWIYCLRKSIIRLVNRLRLSNFEVMEKKRFDTRRCLSYLQVSCCILVRVWRAVTGSPRQRLKADYPKTRFR